MASAALWNPHLEVKEAEAGPAGGVVLGDTYPFGPGRPSDGIVSQESKFFALNSLLVVPVMTATKTMMVPHVA